MLGQFGAGSARRGPGQHIPVHRFLNVHLAGMHPEDGFPSVQIGSSTGTPAVKPAGSQQRRIQAFGAVGGRQQNHALAAVKTVHFRQQLVQGLLALVVAAQTAGITLFADGVDLVDKLRYRGPSRWPV